MALVNWTHKINKKQSMLVGKTQPKANASIAWTARKQDHISISSQQPVGLV